MKIRESGRLSNKPSCSERWFTILNYRWTKIPPWFLNEGIFPIWVTNMGYKTELTVPGSKPFLRNERIKPGNASFEAMVGWSKMIPPD